VLLDRRKVKFWQKIIFSIMALLMVGFGLTGILGAFPGCSGSEVSTSDQIESLKTKLKASPGDPATLLALAEAYQQAGAQSTDADEQTADYVTAAKYYERYLDELEDSTTAADKQKRVDALGILAGLYSTMEKYDDLVRVYGQITDLEPKKAENYLYYGLAAQNAGKNDVAILAFQKYLELAPDSADAPEVQDALDQLLGSASPSPTSGGSE